MKRNGSCQKLGIGTGLLVYYNESNWVWTVWTFPNLLIVQPILWIYYWKRCKGLSSAFEMWNR